MVSTANSLFSALLVELAGSGFCIVCSLVVKFRSLFRMKLQCPVVSSRTPVVCPLYIPQSPVITFMICLMCILQHLVAKHSSLFGVHSAIWWPFSTAKMQLYHTILALLTKLEVPCVTFGYSASVSAQIQK